MFQPPRGTRDYLPKEMNVRNKLFENMRKVFEKYGYGEVCTPAFEDFSLLSKKSGPDIENEIYAFKDKGGRKLGLRFDPTVPICRIVASDPSLTKPIKWYYITRMWRYDRPQAGRYREFWQAGLETIGPKEGLADAEILAVANDLFKAVGAKNFYFRINSRKIVESFVKKAGIPENKKFDAFRAMDKLDKFGEDEVIKEMRGYGIASDVINKLLDLIKTGQADKEELKELEEIKALSEKMGVKDVEIDLSIVRGIDYYTGFVFETLIKGQEKLGSVCSGGRYDSLIALYGKKQVPATGFGLGIDRLLDILGYKEKYESVKVFVAIAKKEVMEKALEITQTLRNKGIAADTELMNRDLRKQFDYVNKQNIPYVLIVGPKDLANKEVTLRDMKTGKEKKLKISEITKFFS